MGNVHCKMHKVFIYFPLLSFTLLLYYIYYINIYIKIQDKITPFLVLYKTLIGIATIAMPKITLYTSKRTKHSGYSEHNHQPAYLLTQRQAVTHQNAHKSKTTPMHQQKPTKCTAPRRRQKNPIKDAKGTAIEATPGEPGTPSAKGTVKATTSQANRATKRRAAIIYYKAFLL